MAAKVCGSVWAAQLADLLTGLADRLAGYRAGVDDNGVFQPRLGGQIGHRLGLVSVEAATESGEYRGGHTPTPA
jgi:hypothetical protein